MRHKVWQHRHPMAVADALASHVREGGSSPWTVPSHWLEALKMIDWVPIVFVTFKVLVFGTAMFFAIKWHYDQGKKKGASRRELLIASGKIVAVFTLLLLCVLLFTFGLATMLGMDLSL